MNGPDTTSAPKYPALIAAGCLVLILVGGITLIVGIGTDPVRAWRIYLVNFLFFTGIGVGGVLFACVLNIASGRWGRNVKRVAEGLGMFLPVSFILFLLMVPGLKSILPWVKHPYGPAWWLDLGFLVWRDGLSILALALLGMYVVYLSLRVDFGHEQENGGSLRGGLRRIMVRNWRGSATEAAEARRRLSLFSPIYAIAFAVVLTLIGVDLIMSLKEGWYSTLIGAYYFVGSFYVSLAALLVGVIWVRKKYGLDDQIRPNHLHDIAKLTMGFGIVTGDFFYTQLLVIWYGNLPVETSFLIDRMTNTPWRLIGILVLVLCFVLPLVSMLRQEPKRRAGPMLLFGMCVLAAMWMERFFLIGPSLMGKEHIVFGWTEILVTLGFLGLLVLTFVTFMHRVPPVVLRDPVLDAAAESG